MRDVLVLAWQEHCMWVSLQICFGELAEPSPGGGQQVDSAPEQVLRCSPGMHWGVDDLCGLVREPPETVSARGPSPRQVSARASPGQPSAVLLLGWGLRLRSQRAQGGLLSYHSTARSRGGGHRIQTLLVATPSAPDSVAAS